MPGDTVEFFHSLHLSAQLNVSTSVISSTLHRFLRAGIVSLTFVLLMFLIYFIFYFFYFFFNLIIIFSRATVSAVLQPCRTCHMLFILLACCVVYVLGK